MFWLGAKFKSAEFRANFLMCIFIASVIMSNVLGSKISNFNILGFDVAFSVGLIPFFMTFFILDAINEVHGRQKAREMIWLGVLTLVFVAIVTLISVALPFAQRSWLTPEQFNPVFDAGLRIIIASIIAFMLADLNDALVFSKLKENFKGKLLWLRSNVSNFIGQTIDTFVFMFLAFFNFFGLLGGYDAAFVVSIALPYLFLKLVLSVFNTPIVYAAVKWLRG
ncbi:MAG TPA: queuosine precursor transporter [archaeon]|nr:queuosine precursor transporter [archaeon]